MKLFVGSAACVASMVALGCGSISGSESNDVLVTTDKPSYEAASLAGGRFGFQVITRTENVSSRNVIVGRCFPDSRLPIYNVGMADTKGDPMSAYNVAWACVAHDNNFVLTPGAVRVDTLFLTAPNAVNHTGGGSLILGQMEGRMVIAFAVSCDHKPCDAGLSNSFELQLAK